MISAETTVATNELKERLGALERRLETLRGHL
jgi:chaperonin cofactor prefoldin